MILQNRKRLLKDLDITEISLVDTGANPGAKVVLFKRDISKEVADPSRMLGIQLLRILSDRVDSLKQEKDIPRMEAWIEVLQSEEGQQFLGLIAKMQSDPILIFKGMENRDITELCDFVEGPHLESFVKALKGELKKGINVPKEMEVVEKILKKDFEGQIEATNKLKLELVKMAKAGDKRTPEKRLLDYLDNHQDVESAILELPNNVAKGEVEEKRDFGPTYEKISKMVDELVSKGEVSSRARGFVKVMDSEPALLVQYYKEQI
jgi:hypothetical protein